MHSSADCLTVFAKSLDYVQPSTAGRARRGGNSVREAHGTLPAERDVGARARGRAAGRTRAWPGLSSMTSRMRPCRSTAAAMWDAAERRAALDSAQACPQQRRRSAAPAPAAVLLRIASAAGRARDPSATPRRCASAAVSRGPTYAAARAARNCSDRFAPAARLSNRPPCFALSRGAPRSVPRASASRRRSACRRPSSTRRLSPSRRP
jgi:hypothetical protein